MRRISLTAALVFGAGIAALASPAVAADEIGVPPCDKFLQTYKSCVVSKSPEAQRSEANNILEQTKANWKSVAANPEGRAQLTGACMEMTEKMRAETAALNCKW